MSDRQADLSLNVITFLEKGGCTTTMTVVDAEIHIHYTLKNDMKPQPALRITDRPSIIIPKGSQHGVVLSLLNWMGK